MKSCNNSNVKWGSNKPIDEVTYPNNLETNIATLKSTYSCRNCYLRGANLNFVRLGNYGTRGYKGLFLQGSFFLW